MSTVEGIQPVPGPSGAGEEIDLVALLGTLWRGKLWIVLAGILAVSIGGFYAFRVAVPTYSATAVVSLTGQEQSIVDFESVLSSLGGDQASVNTEIEVIRSRQLIEMVVDHLDLLDDPEFNAAVRPHEPGLLDRLPFYEAAGPEPPPTPERQLDRTVDAVLDVLSISNIRQSMVFHITATSEDPRKAAALANAVAQAYIDDQVEAKLEATARATEWLGERMVELRGDFEDAQAALQDFSTNSEIVTYEGLAVLNRQINDLRDRLSGVREQLDATEGTARTRLEAQAVALRRTLDDLEERIGAQSVALAERQELESQVEQFRVLFEYFQTRLRETAVQQGIQQADARVLSRAVVPFDPVAPRKPLIVALSLILGLLAGAGGVLANELRQTGVRSGDELEKMSGLVVMGQLPRTPEIRKRDSIARYLHDNPTSRLAEAIRNLRVSILRSGFDATSRVILSTSSVPGEGKTTQSTALAQSFADTDIRVLLVECDIRRRTMSRAMGFSDEFGLLAVLSGEAELADIVQRDDNMPGVDVLVGDRGKTNPVDVFSSDAFDRFLDRVRRDYDVVVLDAPPVLAVPDARVLAPKADTVLYAVKWNDTPRTAVREGLRLLETVGVRPSGLVLTQVDLKGLARYGYGDYGRYGQGYYGD